MDFTKNYHIFFVFLWFHTMVGFRAASSEMNQIDEQKSLAYVGLLLDSNSPMSVMAEVCTDMAISDFYAAHPNYRTRMIIRKRYSEDIVGAASAAVDLMKNEDVIGIIGAQSLTEATFVIELGRKAHVPIISFSGASPSLSQTQSPYYIRMAPNDSSQAKAITTIIQDFGWHEVVVLFEDTDSDNNQFISYLREEFSDAEIEISRKIGISTSAEDFQIIKELNKLLTLQTRVFLVHMTPSLGSRLFVLANKRGMMSKGFAWLITGSLSSMINSMDMTSVTESMEGVLGIRPHVPKSNDLESFKKRWKKNLFLTKPENATIELNSFGVFAYDIVRALAMAVERIWPLNSTSLKANNSKCATDFANLGISEVGPRFLNEILNTKFKCLSGEFCLVHGQLQSSALEIFNIIGYNAERTVGYWTLKGGISRDLGSTNRLKMILWPGDSTTVPVGWAIPMPLRVLVPIKKGFFEFLNISENPNTKEIQVNGFVKDVFCAALDLLPSILPRNIEIKPVFSMFDGNYNDLVRKISEKACDAVMGDVTIVANRTKFVDFTLPYANSDVYKLVPIKHSQRNDMWIFVKPLSWDLWLTSLVACVFVGLVIRILERRVNSTDTEFTGPLHQIPAMLIWLPFSVLFLPERRVVANSSSRFVLVIWLCMAYILMQFYTANLSSMLTVDQLQPSMNEEGLYKVGYANGSFVKDLLLKRFNFTPDQLQAYTTIEEYHEALSNGTKKGGVAAIYEELPYVKLFLYKYGVNNFKMVGPVHKTDGLGFAFPIGSNLVSPMSRAILNVTQDPEKMRQIKEKNFGYEFSLDDQVPTMSSETPSLQARSFAGPFIIVGIATIIALAYSESSVGQKFIKSVPSIRSGSRVRSTVEMKVTGDLPTISKEEHHPTGTPNHGNTNVSEEEEEQQQKEEEMLSS